MAPRVQNVVLGGRPTTVARCSKGPSHHSGVLAVYMGHQLVLGRHVEERSHDAFLSVSMKERHCSGARGSARCRCHLSTWGKPFRARGREFPCSWLSESTSAGYVPRMALTGPSTAFERGIASCGTQVPEAVATRPRNCACSWPTAHRRRGFFGDAGVVGDLQPRLFHRSALVGLVEEADVVGDMLTGRSGRSQHSALVSQRWTAIAGHSFSGTQRALLMQDLRSEVSPSPPQMGMSSACGMAMAARRVARRRRATSLVAM